MHSKIPRHGGAKEVNHGPFFYFGGEEGGAGMGRAMITRRSATNG